MAANTTPIFTVTPVVTATSFGTANTNRDGTGTIADAFTPGADGSVLEKIRFKATGTTTAGMIRIYVYDGSTYRLVGEVSVSAITVGATTQSFEATWLPPNNEPMALPSGRKVGVSTHNAETFVATAIGGSF